MIAAFNRRLLQLSIITETFWLNDCNLIEAWLIQGDRKYITQTLWLPFHRNKGFQKYLILSEPLRFIIDYFYLNKCTCVEECSWYKLLLSCDRIKKYIFRFLFCKVSMKTNSMADYGK